MKESSIPVEPKADNDLIEEAAHYVQSLFDKHRSLSAFHTIDHAKEIAAVAYDLAQEYDLEEHEQETLMLAAWFYFSGFTRKVRNFQVASSEIAREFLTGKEYSESLQLEVCGLLHEEHCSDTSPLLTQLLHDALSSYLGRKRFFRKMELLRIERENLLGKVYTDYEWEQLVFRYLTAHRFLTSAGKQEYRKRKVKNINKQRKYVNKAHKTTTRQNTGKDFGRGVDTLYRSNYNNHIALSSIADGKSNMMISINTIILSVIVTLSGAGFTFGSTFKVEHLRYTVPIFILLAGSLVSVIFAVLSARPKVTNVEIDMQKVRRNKSSLIYFGNFLQVPLQDFIDHLSNLKKSQQRLYDSMSTDLYYLGMVLDKKYRLLTWSYNIFMCALALSVVAFTIIFFYTNSSL